MNFVHRFLGSIIVSGLLCSSQARADIPPAPADLPNGKSSTSLDVAVNSQKDISFLRISRSALRQAGLDVPDKQSHWSPSEPRSIVAATAMSLCIAGAFLLRGKRRIGVALGFVAATMVGAVGVQAWGNAAAPPHHPVQGTITNNFSGQVVIEITDDLGVNLAIGTKALPKYVPNRPQAVPPGK